MKHEKSVNLATAPGSAGSEYTENVLAANDPQTAHPIVNLVVWLIAIGMIATVAAVAGGRLVAIVGAMFVADTPLAGRIAVAAGMGVMAVMLLAFFVWLVTALVRNAASHVTRRRQR